MSMLKTEGAIVICSMEVLQMLQMLIIMNIRGVLNRQTRWVQIRIRVS